MNGRTALEHLGNQRSGRAARGRDFSHSNGVSCGLMLPREIDAGAALSLPSEGSSTLSSRRIVSAGISLRRQAAKHATQDITQSFGPFAPLMLGVRHAQHHGGEREQRVTEALQGVASGHC